VEYSTSRHIWEETGRWTSLPGISPQNWVTGEGGEEWFEKMVGTAASTKQKGICSLVVILVCWAVWRERNARISDAKEK
jgi:hypothetical protein